MWSRAEITAKFAVLQKVEQSRCDGGMRWTELVFAWPPRHRRPWRPPHWIRDESAYRDFRDRYRAMANSLGFEGHMQSANAMS